MMLIALALVMISPALMVAMLLAGGILGLFNARLAHAWIAWYKRGQITTSVKWINIILNILPLM